jgi:hypothetical protein
MPRALQVLAGCYPIAQTREPYTAIKYLAERVDLIALYKLKPVPDIHDYGQYIASHRTLDIILTSRIPLTLHVAGTLNVALLYKEVTLSTY